MILTTRRLSLRGWRSGDLAALTALNAEPEVHRWLGGPAIVQKSAAALIRMQDQLTAQGWGVLALTGPGGEVLGLGGLQPCAAHLAPAPAVEAVWRLRPSAWGQGYVAEAMAAILPAAREAGAPSRVVALVAEPNHRSAATARRLGFRREPARDFLHPDLPVDHPLRPHLVFAAELDAQPGGSSA